MATQTRGTSGRIMRVAIAAMKNLSGAQYATIMSRSGLSRYIDSLPPDTDEVALTEDEAKRINETVYQMLGEDLYRLWQRNIGTTVGQGLVQSAWGESLRARASAIPADERLAWVIGEYAQLANRGITSLVVEEDAQGWYLRLTHCTNCEGLERAKAPLCGAVGGVVRAVVEHVLGQRVRSEEITCRALGAPACKFAVYK